MRNPAMAAIRVEANSRRAMRNTTSTARMPTTAVEMRQPKEFWAPNAAETEGDHPFAERRMRDERRVRAEDVDLPGRELRVGLVGPAALVAEVQEGPRVLHVERLVEDEHVRVAEVPQPEDGGEQRDRDGRAPVPEPQPLRCAEHASPPVVEPAARPFGAGCVRGRRGVGQGERGHQNMLGVSGHQIGGSGLMGVSSIGSMRWIHAAGSCGDPDSDAAAGPGSSVRVDVGGRDEVRHLVAHADLPAVVVHPVVVAAA